MAVKSQTRSKSEIAFLQFQKMEPSLSRYASSIAKKRVRVVASGITQTDGKIIEIRPPMILADKPKHRDDVCGLRSGKAQTLLCAACASREAIISHLHHEIAHIVYGSFDEYDLDREDFPDTIMAIFPEYRVPIYSMISTGEKVNSVRFAGETHPHLAAINMPMEDQRINTASYKDNSGLEIMMRAGTGDIFYNGIEDDDGTFIKWQDRGRDEQMMIAPLFHMEGFDIDGQFDPDVVEAIYDPRVQANLALVRIASSSKEILVLSAKLLKRFRELGFFLKNAGPAGKMNAKQKQELEDFLKLLGKILEGVLGHDETEEGVACGIGDGTGSGHSDKLPDHEMELVAKCLTWLDNVPGHMRGLNVYPRGDGPAYFIRPGRGGRTGVDLKSPESVVGNAVAKARIAFGINARTNRHRNQKAGRIHSGSLGKRAWNPKDGRLFQTKTVPDNRDYEVLIGFDISYSTMSKVPGYDKTRLTMLKESVMALGEVCSRLGIPFSILAHTTGDGGSMDIYQMKGVKDHWDTKTKTLVSRIGAGSSNFDGNTLQFYRKQIEKSSATDKIILYFTDGVMPGAATESELPVLRSEIELCRKRGITLLGVGVCSSAPMDHGLDTVRVDSEADYPKVVAHLGKRLMSA